MWKKLDGKTNMITFNILNTYFLRISSCISDVDGPAGFGPEKSMQYI